ncbi:hypothetical protein [Kurthia sibirica]|uniref:Uncharacterized protein n=1 Tax=Kurthia sibirica TaxID=202750 RepID=A0A2U3AJ39_9BACL|nr:hypothetical protein [Kurthia sibirica]PWI24514.1 hypothetical protein DEX24_13055 [Kurthia sibirica]GEK33583.1 hypothetical protein KSI01_11160 [Kurthia sibirica]
MKTIYSRQGIISKTTVKDDYILLQTVDCIFHLPLTTEILHGGDGERRTVDELKKGDHFINYFSHGQHVLVMKEQDDYFGVISGVYDAEKKMVDHALIMRVDAHKTKHLGAPLQNGSNVLAFCQMMTASLPPQATPTTLFVFKP